MDQQCNRLACVINYVLVGANRALYNTAFSNQLRRYVPEKELRSPYYGEGEEGIRAFFTVSANARLRFSATATGAAIVLPLAT